MIMGKISASDSNGLKLIIDGETEATTKKYKYLASYIPAVNDRVLIEEIGDSYVILGKVISSSSNAGKANSLKPYSSGSSKIEFTYFNSSLWVRIDESTQFALAKQT